MKASRVLRLARLWVLITWSGSWLRWHKARHDHHAVRAGALLERAERIEMELSVIELTV